MILFNSDSTLEDLCTVHLTTSYGETSNVLKECPSLRMNDDSVIFDSLVYVDKHYTPVINSDALRT